MKKLWMLVVGLVVLGAVSLTGCTKGCSIGNTVGCAVENVAASAVVPAIAAGLQCSNPDAIKGTLLLLGEKAGLCTGQQAGVGSAICMSLSGLVVDSVASAGIPAAWGCTAANAKDLLKGVINQACAKIP